MNRDEWNQWHDDLARRLPETADYIAFGLDDESRDVWFRDIFSQFELRDALAVNRKLFETGIGTAKFERDKLPALFVKMLQEQSYNRSKRENGQHKPWVGSQNAVMSNATMGPAYRMLRDRIQEWKDAHDNVMPDHTEIRYWVDEIFAELERKTKT